MWAAGDGTGWIEDGHGGAVFVPGDGEMDGELLSDGPAAQEIRAGAA